MKALVAEDDPLNRELLLRMMTRLGWDADAVSSGQAALQFYGRTRYDVVMLDYHLGDMNGRAVAAALRTTGQPGCAGTPGHSQTPDTRPEAGAELPVPIIAVTGSELVTDTDGLFSGVVRKPFVMEDLRVELERLGLG